MKEKLTLALSPDVVAIIRRAGKRRMGEFVEVCVRIAEGQVKPGVGILERMAEDLAELAKQGGKP